MRKIEKLRGREYHHLDASVMQKALQETERGYPELKTSIYNESGLYF